MQPYKINGAVALVTGSSRGLGRALLTALLERGVKKVYATARQTDSLLDLTDIKVVPLQLDVTDADQVSTVAKATTDVDLVFNNAGVLLAGGLSNAELVEQARREMDVSYFGALRLIQNLAPTLARNGGGALVNIGSAAGLSNVAFFPTYSASKAALHSLTQAARVLLGPQNTLVFGVYGGPIDTDMVRELAMPKTPPRDVAMAILNGIEAGDEDIYPDPFALRFGQQFEISPKTAERQNAAMVRGAK
jgi:NAD(P)-dependent dehydrogenase (short-subunit alcohol dehydrogenase family)